jgi:hypothetical protein
MAIQFNNSNTGVATLRSGTATDAITIGGSTNTATNTNAFSSGADSQATGKQGFVAGGTANTASGTDSCVAGGANNLSNATTAIVIGGRYGTTRSIISNTVFPANNVPITSGSGISQSALLVLGTQTIDATATVLRNNTSSASTTNQVILPNNAAYFFTGEVIAGVTGAGDTKGWTVEGVIKRGANAASTALVGSTVTSMYADAGAATWAITATADTTNGGLAITVTGQASTTIRWVAQIRTTEMTY